MEDGRLFVEETSLVTGRRPSWSQLRSRLEARLDRMGMGEYPLTLVERCIIPMDSPLPDLTSPFVAFGASASMVHPATGYQLAAAMRHAPALANSLAQSMDDTLVRASALAWDVLWPAERRRVRELHLFGTRFVATLEGPEQAAFFDHFFSLPPDLRRAYLSIDAGLTEVCQAMLSLFRELPGSLRWRLARRGASSPLPLVRPILGV